MATESVAFEISPLITASGTFGDKSGVYRYTYGLLSEYVRQIKKENSNTKIILFSFNKELLVRPLNAAMIRLLKEKNVIYLNKTQLKKYSSIGDYLLFENPLIKILLRLGNRLFNLKGLYLELKDHLDQQEYLNFLREEFLKYNAKVIYHSETGFCALPGFANVITVYDLTAVLLPQLHRAETTQLQQQKLRFAKNYCQGIISISHSTQKDLLQYMDGFQQKKLAVCYPGLDEGFVDSRSEQKKIGMKQINKILKRAKTRLVRSRYLLHYGTFEPRKNINLLIEAFSNLQNTHQIPADFKLVLMGGEGWGETRQLIQNYIEESYPILQERNVIILSYLDDKYLKAFIRSAYAIVYPSLYEGFGLPVLESMSLRTPVICSNTSSLPEVGGDAVLYVDPTDYFDLEKKIKLLINDAKLARRIVRRGRKQSKKFTWEKTVREFRKFVQTL